MVVERGLAAAWGIALGGRIDVDGLGALRVVGFSEAPTTSAYPLAAPRVYISQAASRRCSGPPDPNVNVAEIWLRDPRNLNEVLVQARPTSYGLRGLRFITRSGVRVLLDQAAGIVIDLLVALSLIALATAGVMLAASARAEVQRRLDAIGSAARSAPRAATWSRRRRSRRCSSPRRRPRSACSAARSPPSGRRPVADDAERARPGVGAAARRSRMAWLASVAIPVLAAAWPAWRAAGRSPVALLRGAELARGSRRLPTRAPVSPPSACGSPARAARA